MLLSKRSPYGTGIDSRPPRHRFQHDWWLLLFVKCHSHWRLFILPPAFHKEQLKYFTWPIWGNGKNQMKCMTHSAPYTKWLNYADDMLQFIGLLRHSDCGWAGPDLEGTKRLLCVWGWTGKIYKERHLKLKPDACVWECVLMCVYVCVCKRSACFKDCWPCNRLACDFF